MKIKNFPDNWEYVLVHEVNGETHSYGWRLRKKFEREPKICYNPAEIINKAGNKSMSIVGIIECKDGIVMFGDSKSSMRGQYVEEHGRGDINKCFKIKHLLVCYCGNNTIRGQKMEYFLPEFLNDISSFPDFVKKLEIYLQTFDYKKELDGGDITFVCYDPMNGGTHTLLLDKYGVHKNRDYIFIGHIAGYQFYTDCLIQFVRNKAKNSEEPLDIPCKDFAKELDEEIERLIGIFNLTGYYNPVGGKIQIKCIAKDDFESLEIMSMEDLQRLLYKGEKGMTQRNRKNRKHKNR